LVEVEESLYGADTIYDEKNMPLFKCSTDEVKPDLRLGSLRFSCSGSAAGTPRYYLIMLTTPAAAQASEEELRVESLQSRLQRSETVSSSVIQKRMSNVDTISVQIMSPKDERNALEFFTTAVRSIKDNGK